MPKNNMATRSYVGVVNQDGSVEQVYVQLDGYPAGVGQMLQGYYLAESKVRALISRGSVCELREIEAPCKGANPDKVTLYISGDETVPMRYPSVKAATDMDSLHIEWIYLFRPDGNGMGVWSCIDTTTMQERPLLDVLAEIKG